jgi:hypothetical protein
MTQEEVNELNLNSAEGKMFNAAMAILTTEYKPKETFGWMFDKVKALAVQLPDSESTPASKPEGEEDVHYEISKLLRIINSISTSHNYYLTVEPKIKPNEMD